MICWVHYVLCACCLCKRFGVNAVRGCLLNGSILASDYGATYYPVDITSTIYNSLDITGTTHDPVDIAGTMWALLSSRGSYNLIRIASDGKGMKNESSSNLILKKYDTCLAEIESMNQTIFGRNIHFIESWACWWGIPTGGCLEGFHSWRALLLADCTWYFALPFLWWKLLWNPSTESVGTPVT